MKFVLGTVQLGVRYGIANKVGKPTLDSSLELLDSAKQLGIKYLDTSDLYGDSAEVIARYGSTNFRILSKFSLEGNKRFLNTLETSLKRLEVDSLYGYSFHRYEDFENYKDWQIVRNAKDARKIEMVGVSVYSTDQLEKAINHPEVDMIQSPFNLLDNYSLRGAHFELAKSRGKQIHVRSIFLQGLLLMNPGEYNGNLTQLTPAVGKLKSIADRIGCSMQELCFRYVNSFQSIDAVVVGTENIIQLKNSFELSKSPGLIPSVIDEIHAIIVDESDLLNPSTWRPV